MNTSESWPSQTTVPLSSNAFLFNILVLPLGSLFVHTDEEELYQRDFTAPTLEDHFDKTKLPEVLCVKNYGRAGRTKYAHLVTRTPRPLTRPGRPKVLWRLSSKWRTVVASRRYSKNPQESVVASVLMASSSSIAVCPSLHLTCPPYAL